MARHLGPLCFCGGYLCSAQQSEIGLIPLAARATHSLHQSAHSFSPVSPTVSLLLQKRGVGYPDVGVSYEAVVSEGQHWRILTAAFSHITFLHLIFNMSALWSLGVVETLGEVGLGKVYYLKYTLVLLVLSGLLVLGMYHLLIFRCRLEHYKRVTAVGYSCVVFGWMTILAVKQPVSKLELFGVVPLPVHLAPFESLIMTSIIVPQASFVGHLAGILVGYLIAWGAFQDFSNYWACTLAMWLGFGFLISLKQTSNIEMPFLHIESVADPSLAPLRVTSPTRSPVPPLPPLPAQDDYV